MPTYRLLSGSMSRWVNGERKRHTAGTDTALISDLSLAEIETHKARLEFVSAEPFATTKPRAPLAPVEVPKAEPVKPDLEPEPEDVVEPEPEVEEIDWSGVLSGNVASVKEYIATTLDEVQMVESLMAAEGEGKVRSSILKACAERIAALTPDEEE